MRPLDLDFQPRRSASAGGWLLLLIGALCAGFAFLTERQLDDETRVHEATVRSIERTLPGAARAPLSAAESRAEAAVLADMRRVVAQLNLPWNGLFDTLESVAVGDIALLTLTPDARKRQIRIAAEARNLEAMLEFHRRLEADARMRDVALVSHEIETQVAERPVRFNLTANWMVSDARP